MVSIDQVQRGVAQFVERELLPKMQGKDKWIVTGITTLGLSKLPSLLQTAQGNDVIKVLGIVGEDGYLDMESIIEAVRPAMRATPAIIQIPMGGTVKITEADVDMLYQYIIQS